MYSTMMMRRCFKLLLLFCWSLSANNLVVGFHVKPSMLRNNGMRWSHRHHHHSTFCRRFVVAPVTSSPSDDDDADDVIGIITPQQTDDHNANMKIPWIATSVKSIAAAAATTALTASAAILILCFGALPSSVHAAAETASSSSSRIIGEIRGSGIVFKASGLARRRWIRADDVRDAA
jgi:hypothetical protein